MSLNIFIDKMGTTLFDQREQPLGIAMDELQTLQRPRKTALMALVTILLGLAALYVSHFHRFCLHIVVGSSLSRAYGHAFNTDGFSTSRWNKRSSCWPRLLRCARTDSRILGNANHTGGADTCLPSATSRARSGRQ